MINFECPKCHASLAVEDSLAGLSAQCPQCGNINTVPGSRLTQMESDIKARCSKAALPAPDEKSRMWCALCHIGGILSFPLNIVVPLVFWLIKKDELPLVDQHGKAALNFQITCAIVYLISACLIWLFGIGMLIAVVTFLLNVIFSLIAVIKSATGKEAKYPFLFRFVS
jgi:uncharacterized Tic20 family protein